MNDECDKKGKEKKGRLSVEIQHLNQRAGHVINRLNHPNSLK